MLTNNPAKVMGIDAGVLKKEAEADIVIFDDDISIEKIFVSGMEVKVL